jgi:hypothetical protein
VPNPKNACTVNEPRARPFSKVKGGGWCVLRKGCALEDELTFQKRRSVTHGLAVKSATPGDGLNRKGQYRTGKRTVPIIRVGTKCHRIASFGCHDSAAMSLAVTSS